MTPHHKRDWIVIATSLLLITTGCKPPSGPDVNVDPEPRPLATRSNEQILLTLQSNEAKLNRALYSTSVAVVAHIADKEGKDHAYNLEGTMLFQRPRNLLINLRPGIGDNVMQVGSNESDYWAWVEPELSQMWWGRHENAGKPCADKVLVNPSELVAAMGIGLPSADSGLSGPMRKEGKRSDLLYYGRMTSDGAWRLIQEYRVMREPPYLVDVVIFYNEYGQKAMTASLEDHREAWEGGPMMAHKISVIWPIEKNKLSIKIDNFKNFDESKIRAKAFARPTDSPPLPPGVFANTTQVDAGCDRIDRSESSVEPAGWNDDWSPFDDANIDDEFEFGELADPAEAP